MKKFFTLFMLGLLMCPTASAISGQQIWKSEFFPSPQHQKHKYWCVHACNAMLHKRHHSQEESFLSYYLMGVPSEIHQEIRKQVAENPDLLDMLIMGVGPVKSQYVNELCGFSGYKTLDRAFTKNGERVWLPTMLVVSNSSILNGSHPGVFSRISDDNIGHAIVLLSVYYYFNDILSPDRYIITYIDPGYGAVREILVDNFSVGGFSVYY